MHWPLLATVSITLSALVWPDDWPFEGAIITRLSLGWIVGVLVFLGATLRRAFKDGSPERLRTRAAALDEAGPAILPLALFAALASVASVVGEIAVPGPMSIAQSVVALATVAVSWLFIHVIFAVHYAGRYYAAAESGRDQGGLLFPGGEPPDDWDFLHFSLIIGVASQTADIEIASQRLRRLATVHSLVAFVFNTIILALAINLIVNLV